MRTIRIAIASACFTALPSLATAHPLTGVGDFYAGMLHPLTSLEFAVPLIALALFAGQQRRVAAIIALASFPVAVMAGAASSVLFSPSSGPSVIATGWAGPAIMAVSGLCVALAWQSPAIGAAALFSLFGFLLGVTQGAEITATMSAPKFILGVGCLGLIVMGYGIGLVRKLRWPWTHVAVRVVGSWVAAAGLMVLALTKH